MFENEIWNMLLVREEAEGGIVKETYCLGPVLASAAWGGESEKQRGLSFDSAQADDVLFTTRSLKNGELA